MAAHLIEGGGGEKAALRALTGGAAGI
jgi:hypothetical protein